MLWRDLAVVVLAAGNGTRLAPLTLERPKALCPVGGLPLLERVLQLVPGADCAVNAHHRADQLINWLDGRAHISHEPELLGSAGALGQLKSWIDGRDVVVVNADAVHGHRLDTLAQLQGVAVLSADAPGTEFHPRLTVIGSRISWSLVDRLTATPSGLYEEIWRPAARRGELTVVGLGGPFFDCGTPQRYLAAHHWLTGDDVCRWPQARDISAELRSCIVTPRRIVMVPPSSVR
jgi:N-acetyl-alpha-D-muramate 1-phosphate uridylyltransferase